MVIVFHGQVLGHVRYAVLGLMQVESGEGEDMARSIPIPVDRHEDLMSLVILHFQDQPAKGGTIVGSTGHRDIQLDEVLGAGLAEAARDVALLVVGGVEGVPFLLSGVELEDIHQAEGKVGVGGEVQEVEDSTDHGLGCRLQVSLTVNMSNSETRVVRPANRGGCHGGRSSRFGFLLTIPQWPNLEPEAESMVGVGRVQGFEDDLFQVGWVHITMGAKYPASTSHIGRLKSIEGDMGANGIKLGLAVGSE